MIETVTVVPDIYFPNFPVLQGVSFDDDTGLVSMTLEDYRRIAEYKIRVDECKSVYYKMKELYQEEEYEDKGS